MSPRTVAGEPLELLQAAIGKLKRSKTSDGMVELSGSLERELGEPLLRALFRIEKELLDQDVAHGHPDVRSSSERRADAFVLLAQRVTSSVDQS